MKKKLYKKRKMKLFIKKIGRLAIGISKGIADTIFPNITQSIKNKENDFPYDKKIEINYTRLISSITIWFILLLLMYDKVQFSDVLEILNKLLSLLN